MGSKRVNVEDVRENMSCNNTKKTRWASPSDWEVQRQRIVYLYKSLDYPLRTVMHIMQNEHHFFATQKMYKYYLHKWGIRKNLRAAQVHEFLQQAQQGDDTTSIFIVEGVKMDHKRLGNYFRRVSRYRNCNVNGPDESKAALLSGPAKYHTPSPEQALSHPYRTGFEKMLHATRTYVSGNFDSGSWSKSHIPWKNDLMITAHNNAWSVGRLMNSGQIAQAFRVLNICLDSCRDFLVSETPLFPLGMYAVLFEFSKKNETLARSIMSFLRDMVLVTHRSELHPVYILFDTMSRMTPEQLCQCAWTLGVAYHTALLTELGTNSAFDAELSALYGRSISWLAAYAPVEDCTAEQALQEHARYLAAGGQATSEALEAKMRLANFFLDRRRYSEARVAAEEVMFLENSGGPGTNNAYLIDDCHRILFWVSRNDGSHGEAVRAARRWVEYCTTELGPSHELTVDALGEVAEYFRDVGDLEAASKARHDYQVAVDELCERLEQVGLEADGSSSQRKTMLYGRTSQRGSSGCH
ncbi:hypothetical protein VP1G_04249 [Cytospora mali]|uniref:Clr5 domain-containing protein n=1 Tax=Cytospora mali TaxID=578113 RepID=A0A194UZ93_CYTMA|nr:hypothetical protein VP1G_04249 [Valsa mali var. pyri (nom. inval.)]